MSDFTIGYVRPRTDEERNVAASARFKIFLRQQANLNRARRRRGILYASLRAFRQPSCRTGNSGFDSRVRQDAWPQASSEAFDMPRLRCNVSAVISFVRNIMTKEIAVLAIPPDILDKLHRRALLAAEVPTSEPEIRAFVVVIPKVTVPEPTTHNLSPVLGYEIRYIRHHEKHTSPDYDYDADRLLACETTRIKRLCVRRKQNEEPLITELLKRMTDLSVFQRHYDLNSPLVGFLSDADLDYYIAHPDEDTHLWEE